MESVVLPRILGSFQAHADTLHPQVLEVIPPPTPRSSISAVIQTDSSPPQLHTVVASPFDQSYGSFMCLFDWKMAWYGGEGVVWLSGRWHGMAPGEKEVSAGPVGRMIPEIDYRSSRFIEWTF